MIAYDLWAALPIVSAALIFYGAGIGIESIARATVPLALFGHTRYASIMGQIAMPSLIAQAAAPSIGAALMELFGPGVTLGALFATAVLNVALVVVLFGLLLRQNPDPLGDTPAFRRTASDKPDYHVGKPNQSSGIPIDDL